MGADLPGEADESPDGDSGPQGGASGGDQRAPAETRSRGEYYVVLHQAVSAAAQQDVADEQAEAEKWDQVAAESRWMWGEYERKWPPDERAPVDTSADPPGSWRADADRFLPAAANRRVDQECDRVEDRERDVISPAMQAIESQDPNRHLVGFGDRLKGHDRIKEKVVERIEEKNRTPEEAVSLTPDTIRYTFQYKTTRYTEGVRADIMRLKEHGFELSKLKNSWSSDQYRGINSQWLEPDTGQRFEVQFHTRVSFEAKQLTHDAYERLRTKQADKFEELVLEAFQAKVTAQVSVPPGAADIPDYP
ncbi:MAG: hypothetical protein ABSB59_41240 [Streptosporangiaceae bacterium]